MAQRFEGKNLEEALAHAAETLGVPRYKIHHAILLEKRGFLGGVKRVVIEADVNEEAPAPPEPVQAEAPSSIPASAPPRADRGGRGGGGGGRSRGRSGRSRGGERSDRGGRGRGPRRERREEDELQPGDFERFAVEIPEQGPESEAAQTVREWCEEVIDLARFDLTVRTEENETQIIVRLYGRDSRLLVDQHGEVLDAMQVLANKAMVGRKVEKDIELDCAGFKSRRHDEIEQTAREVADRVRRDGREQLLPAMTPIERRIVHLALQDDAEVATESRGEGFYKRVAIVPKSASEPREDAPAAQ